MRSCGAWCTDPIAFEARLTVDLAMHFVNQPVGWQNYKKHPKTRQRLHPAGLINLTTGETT
jgi:hypothetical protein